MSLINMIPKNDSVDAKLIYYEKNIDYRFRMA